MGVRPAFWMPLLVQAPGLPGTLQASLVLMVAAWVEPSSPSGTCKKPRPGESLRNQVGPTARQLMKRPKSVMPWA
jgi:hypothetical protein